MNMAHQTLTISLALSSATMTNLQHSNHPQIQTSWLSLLHWVCLCPGLVCLKQLEFLGYHDAEIKIQ